MARRRRLQATAEHQENIWRLAPSGLLHQVCRSRCFLRAVRPQASQLQPSSTATMQCRTKPLISSSATRSLQHFCNMTSPYWSTLQKCFLWNSSLALPFVGLPTCCTSHHHLSAHDNPLKALFSICAKPSSTPGTPIARPNFDKPCRWCNMLSTVLQLVGNPLRDLSKSMLPRVVVVAGSQHVATKSFAGI